MKRVGVHTLVVGLLAVTFSALTAPPEALAARAATPDEADAIYSALGNSRTQGCAAYISTVDDNWAVVSGCSVAPGEWNLLSRYGTGWSHSAITGDSNSACPLADVHVTVTADLGICPPISALPYLPAYPFSQPADLFLFIKPKDMVPLTGSKGYYRKIRWSSWGMNEARGRGEYFYQFMGTKKRIRFRVELYGAKTCGNGVRIFTRRKLHALHPKQTTWFRSDAKKTRIGSCEDNEATEIY